MATANIQSTASTLGLYAIQPPKPGSPPVTHPQDGNRDGLVSFGEAWTYSLKHPEIGILKELRTTKEPVFNIGQDNPVNPVPSRPYDQTGNLAPARGTTIGNLDVRV